MVCHPKPDILEWEVKWALRSTAVNKASRCNEIPAELFKSLKEDAIKICIHHVSKSRRHSSGYRTGKGQSASQFPRRVVPKNVLTHQTVVLISHASKVMLKILHARLQYHANQEFPDVQAGFRKGRTRDQIAKFSGL